MKGTGKNDYIRTSRPLVIVTAPGPGSGKMATCLSQLYHEHKRGIRAGYAKFETFPIWNLPLKHPVNLAYEAATADLNDVNMIDPFHLEAYGTRDLVSGTLRYSRFSTRFSKKSTGKVRTNPPQTWGSTWPATASAMTLSAGKRHVRKSSVAIMPH